MLTQAAVIVIAITTVLGVLAVVAVGLRLHCRRLQQLPLAGDDYCVILALVVSTGISVVSDYAAAVTGIGDPSYVPTSEAVVFAAKVLLAIEIAQPAALGLAKVSLLIYYRRIFIMDWFLACSAAVITIITGYTLAIILAIIFAKWPVDGQWNPKIPFDLDTAAVLVTFVSLSFTFDLVTLAMPLIALRNLAIRKKQKLFLSAVFSFGSLVIASICRLYYAVRYVNTDPTTSSVFEAPFTYNILWATIEPPAFIITGCLLTFGPLYRSQEDYAGNARSPRNLSKQQLDQPNYEASTISNSSNDKDTVCRQA